MRWPLLALFCARADAWVARQHAVMGLHEWRADVTQWGTKPARLGCLPMPLGQELLVGEVRTRACPPPPSLPVSAREVSLSLAHDPRALCAACGAGFERRLQA